MEKYVCNLTQCCPCEGLLMTISCKFTQVLVSHIKLPVLIYTHCLPKCLNALLMCFASQVSLNLCYKVLTVNWNFLFMLILSINALPLTLFCKSALHCIFLLNKEAKKLEVMQKVALKFFSFFICGLRQ